MSMWGRLLVSAWLMFYEGLSYEVWTSKRSCLPSSIIARDHYDLGFGSG
jgi:hypothetical protein